MTLEWLIFSVAIAGLFFLDLFFLRKKHISKKRSLGQIFLILLVVFSLFFLLLIRHSQQHALDFFTAYALELSLSIDNVFIFFILFKSLNIPLIHQKRILVWGIISALILRCLFIFLGLLLLKHVWWIVYIFGSILLYGGYKMLTETLEQESKTLENRLVLLKKFIPFTTQTQNGVFFIRENGALKATIYFIGLLAIEGTDIVFAIDSIPAVLSITQNTFIVISSNILAILGLRSLYVLIATLLERIRYLHYSLAIILIFVGIKSVLTHTWHPPTWVSLGVIGVSLLGGIAFSLLKKKA